MDTQVFQLIKDRFDSLDHKIDDKVDTLEKNMCERLKAIENKVEEQSKQRWMAAGKAAAYGTIGGILSFVVGAIFQFFKNQN